ncbi:CRISPR-associated DxTHG motif protein [Acidianus sulfidivorans JP7]|uniref:CRISPR system endoribonuclease Csx1 CARF domain-containing protein n=1 Tax=Acidianus sulfidivorans JP7 TaxID=619593 RepID=A0A2U9IJF3_9CREN|nr:TM1812 family CRISPR-associated protein [Acidianus sulfidivorans]AWR96161.1 CRISPR-associated DxTHG motif protein [Acidianus sulfidivorans JP7]
MIYITTWGDPSGWGEATYKKENGSEVKSFSTISTYDNASKIVIITLDSVLTPQKQQNQNPKKDNVANSCARKIASDYPTWVNNVKDYVKCIAEKGKEGIPISVIVIPAIGKISDFYYGKITLNIGSLPSYLYTQIVEALLVHSLYNELKDSNEEIVLDTTYGINYLPTITFHVLYNLTSLLGLKLKVINYIPTIFQKEYSFAEILRKGEGYFDLNQIKEKKSEPNEGKADIGKRIFIRSLKYNAPLLTLKICQNTVGDSKDYYNEFVNSVKISDKNEIIIQKKLDPNSAWIDVIYDYVCNKIKDYKNTKEGIEKIGNEIFSKFSSIAPSIISWELNSIYSIAIKENKLNIGEEKKYSEIAEKYKEEENSNMEEMRRHLKYFINCPELFKEYIKVERVDDKTLHNIVIKYKEEENSNMEEMRRHFIAHAGLLKDYIKIKRIGDKTLSLDYDESAIKGLKNILDLKNEDLEKILYNKK